MKPLLAALFLLPLFCAAQGVRVNQYDKFIKKHRLETEPVQLLSSSSGALWVSFLAVGTELFVQTGGWGWGATTIDDGNPFVFLLANDSGVSAEAAGLQTFEMGLERNTFKHRYRIGRAEVEALAANDVAALRKYTFKESSEQKLPREAKARLRRQAGLFLDELKKASLVKPLLQISSADVASHIGDSVRFCSRVYNVRQKGTPSGELLLELQSDFSHPVVAVLIAGADRSQFAAAETYLNKEVCVTGVLTLRDNVPTVTAQTAGQLIPADTRQ